MRLTLAFAALILASVTLLGCTVQGTRSITAWGLGCIPMGSWCVPFAGYWHSTHGEGQHMPALPPEPNIL